MRFVRRFPFLLLTVGEILLSCEAQGQRIARPIKVPVRSCPAADSLLGPPDGEPHSLRGDAFPNRDTVFAYAGESLRDGVEASVRVNRTAGTDAPEAQLYFHVSGTAARGLLADSEAPRVTLVLDDSTFDLGRAHPGVVLGSLERAGAGFDAWVGPFMFLKLAQARQVGLRLGAVHLSATNLARNVRPLYRVALCGPGLD